MPRKRSASLAVGDRARDKTNRRVGHVDDIIRVDGRRQYVISYDEAPQDHFLTSQAKDGAQLPKELVEPE
jgi:hypothetical protein